MDAWMDEWMDRRMDIDAVCRQRLLLPCPLISHTYPEHPEGYDGVKQQDTQAAHKPGQVVQKVAALTLAHFRVFEQHTKPIQRVPQHHQREQQVGDALGRLPQELEVRGEKSETSNRALVTPNYNCPRVCSITLYALCRFFTVPSGQHGPGTQMAPFGASPPSPP